MARLRLIAPALLLIGAVTACASTPGSSATSGATPTQEATPTQVGSSTDAALPSLDLPSDDAELEALIPDDVGGSSMTKASMKGDNFLNQGTDGGAAARAFFEGIGVDPAQVSVAFGFAANGVFVQIFRAPGADADVLLNAYKGATDEELDAPLDWTAANVGGKDVETAVEPESEQTFYLYGVGDLVVVVGSADEALAAEVLSGMP